MAYVKWSKEEIEAVRKACEKVSTISYEFCRQLGDQLGRSSDSVFNCIKRNKINPGAKNETVELSFNVMKKSEEERDFSRLEKTIKHLESEIAEANKHLLTQEVIRREIFGLKDNLPAQPKWTVKADKKPGHAGIPSVLWSDWHWDETVDKTAVMGVNEFNPEIARARAKRLIDRTIDICFNHMVLPEYPGLVINLGGDFFTNEIHEELSVTNSMAICPAFLEVTGILDWAFGELLKHFPRLFVVSVCGNHSRLTKKIHSKEKGYRNLDWLLYQMLEYTWDKVRGDNRIQFLTSSGEEVQYRVYSHRYRLTHGDEFRGGDGIIGSIGPVTRGDNKKRAWSGQTGWEYETLLLGHFHQLIMMEPIIQNGSLIGYSEYAKRNNFKFELPQQALWFTNPKLGITFRIPVKLEDQYKDADSSWVSVNFKE